jgi:hypothetical protein
MQSRRVRWGLAVLTIMAGVSVGLAAQRGGGFGGFGGGRLGCNFNQNIAYDGRFNVMRVVYRGYRSWAADCPVMERHLASMLTELTSINPHAEASNIHLLDDPELLKYPVAYLTEPGSWYPNEDEVQGLRTFLAKGGFLIVDDFFDPADHFGNQWQAFYNGIMQVLPDAQIVRLDETHPVFNTFFSIKSLEIPYPVPRWNWLIGEFYGIHIDNDRTKPLKVIINYNMDVGDYLEWSDEQGLYDFASTNEAYKLMINYVAYGLTH